MLGGLFASILMLAPFATLALGVVLLVAIAVFGIATRAPRSTSDVAVKAPEVEKIRI